MKRATERTRRGKQKIARSVLDPGGPKETRCGTDR